ncbi:MAG: carboxypeptidase regulatory-like domain-containing protein [Pyrinomonadaceae bacterium]
MKNARVSLTLFACLFLSVSIASAQSDRGAITGRVTDPQGAAVVNAKVTATNSSTNESREVTTSDEGNYTLAELKADSYKVTIEAPGFKTSTAPDIVVAVQVTRRADFTLEIGEISSVVTVNSEDTSVLQTDTPARQTNVNERQVRELPLQVSSETAGRSPLAFIFLDSNVTAAAGNGTNATNFRVSGGQGLGTEILIDGAATRRAQNGTFFTEVSPSPNAFQEFTVSTSSYSAEFGNSSGGIVNFSIKSGSNQFHGEGYEYHRNEAFNANSFTNNAAGSDRAGNPLLPRPRDHQNNFGFNVGGPIYFPRFGEGGKSYFSGKDKAFFFFNYEGYRFAQSENVFLTVPTARMRQGDFGELFTDPAILARFGPGGVQIFDPTSGGFGARAAIPGNNIPAYQAATGRTIIDPVGLNILRFFPNPTRDGVFQNYRAQTTRPLTMNQYVGKVDFILTPMQRLGFSYSFRKQTTIQGGAPRFPDPFIASGRWNQFFESHFARLQHDYTISPTVLNHFNAGFTRYKVGNQNTTIGFDNTTLGFRPNSTQNKAFPLIGFPGYSDPADPRGDPRSYQGIASTFFHDQSGDNAVELSDFVSYVRGRHSLKFGGDVRIQQFNVSQLVHPGGEFNFRHNQTSNRDRDNEGWPIASLITGATEFSFNSVQNIDPGWRQFSHSYFFNDDFKVRPNLTVNLGVRYDLPGLRTESKDRFRGFDPFAPNPAAGGRLGAIVGAGGQGGQAKHKSLAAPDRTNIGPRLGFAYAWNDRTVVRGGAGYYYSPIVYGSGGQNNLTGGTIGFNTPVQPNINGGVGGVPDLFLRNYRAVLPTDPNGQFLGSDVDYFDPDFKTSRTLQYSLDLQRELPWNLAISIGYVGHRATRLHSNFERLNAIPFNALKLGAELLNRPLADVNASERAFAGSAGVALPANNNAVFPGFTGTVGQSLRRFPQYRTINNQLESQGQSWYNSMQIKLDRRFSKGFQFGASYTFAKLITNASEDLLGASPIGSLLQNPYDRESLRTVSPNSIPHVFVVNYIVELPFGKGRRFLNHGGLVDKIAGGWQIGAIHRYQSGLPLVIRFTRSSAFGPDTTGFNTDLRPSLTGQPILTNVARTGDRVRIINPAAFTTPPVYNEGAPAQRLANGNVNPAYVAFYADPNRFFGSAPPVLDHARDLPFLSENLSILKKIRFTESMALELGAEAFNLFNRHRFAQPNSDLNNPGAFGFSGIDSGYRPREIQLRLRFIY